MSLDGPHGATSLGNTRLVKHGIAEDESDFRLHVSFAVWRAYFFSTRAGQAALDNGKQYETFKARQAGVRFVTGVGYKVPWQDIDGCIQIDIPEDIRDRFSCEWGDSTSKKGRAAVDIAKELQRRGLIPFPSLSQEIDDQEMQMKGKDILITANWSLQVKCDWWGGHTGLRLQTLECNPLNRH